MSKKLEVVAAAVHGPGGNYVAKAIALAEERGEEVGRLSFDVRHDFWCKLLNRAGDCDCDPHVSILGPRLLGEDAN